jgi:hypothetical protein
MCRESFRAEPQVVMNISDFGKRFLEFLTEDTQSDRRAAAV